MNKRWSVEDSRKLKSLYATHVNDELLKEFPNRTLLGIYKKAVQMGLERDAETEYKNRKLGQGKVEKRGRKTTRQGYIAIHEPSHPRADSGGYVMEHILVWEREHGCAVGDGYCVHHINGKKGDNCPENLVRMRVSEHTIMHHAGVQKSEESKRKISEKAKERYKNNKKSHPLYKEIDIEDMIAFRDSGHTVEEVCQRYKICKKTFYNKVHEYEKMGC